MTVTAPASGWPAEGSATGALLRRLGEPGTPLGEPGTPLGGPGTPLGSIGTWSQGLRTAADIALAAAFPCFVLWGPDLAQIYNDAAIPLLGAEHPAAFGQPLGVGWPEGAALRPLVEAVLRSGETVSRPSFAIARDGAAEREVFTLSCTPLHDAEGRIAGVFCTLIETTPRVRAEASARESQRQLRSLVDGIPQLVWRAVEKGHWTWSSPQWSAYTGLSDAESRGLGWLEALHPEDRDGAMESWRRVGRETGVERGFQADYRIRHAEDGQYRWFQTRAAPMRDEAGAVVEWLGTSTDVDELRRMGQHQRLLLAELQHRVRNTLGVIRSIIRRTVQSSETMEELAMHLDGRIDAFSRVQAAVTRNPERGIDLAQLVADELLAYTAREGKQVRIEGPAVALRPKAAETFALAIHELATNAVKYGALSVLQGHVAVTWETTAGEAATGEEPQLVFHWAESGLPGPCRPSTRRGFGTELLERTLPYELNAVIQQDFGADGLHCTIAMPLTERLVMGGTLAELGRVGRAA